MARLQGSACDKQEQEATSFVHQTAGDIGSEFNSLLTSLSFLDFCIPTKPAAKLFFLQQNLKHILNEVVHVYVSALTEPQLYNEHKYKHFGS